MPRVGSSSSRIFGPVASQRASSTFCWLPPDSSDTFCSGLAALIRRRSMKIFTILSCLALLTRPNGESAVSAASTMFSRTDRFGMMPSVLRSSASNAIPARMAFLIRPRLSGFPASSTVPPSRRKAPTMARAVSLRPEPSRPARPTTSPGRMLTETSCSFRSPLRFSALSSGSRSTSCSSPNAVTPSSRIWRISRPSISETSSMRGKDFKGPLWTTRPSRSTVTLSHTRYSSSIRWLT